MPPATAGGPIIIEHDYECGLTTDLYYKYRWSWSSMLYTFLPKPIKPVTVFELPYSREIFEDIVRHLNSSDALSEARNTIEASFHRQREAMRSVLQVRACFGIFQISSVDDGAPLDLGLLLPCDSMYIQGSRLAGIAVATVGDSVEAECSRLYKRGEYIDALVLDAMASTALEGAIIQVRKEIQEAVKGIKLGQGLFPGTRQMPIDVLRTIFYLLRPGERIGVSLIEDMIMIPFRSTSAVIILSEDGRQ